MLFRPEFSHNLEKPSFCKSLSGEFNPLFADSALRPSYSADEKPLIENERIGFHTGLKPQKVSNFLVLEIPCFETRKYYSKYVWNVRYSPWLLYYLCSRNHGKRGCESPTLSGNSGLLMDYFTWTGHKKNLVSDIFGAFLFFSK